MHNVEVKVDAALIAQLRTGYAEMSGAKLIGAPLSLWGLTPPGTQSREFPHYHWIGQAHPVPASTEQRLITVSHTVRGVFGKAPLA